MILFIQKLLKVTRQQILIKIDKCGDLTIPDEYKNIKLDTDLLLLITAKPESTKFYATAHHCASRKTIPKRPIIGKISWNINSAI